MLFGDMPESVLALFGGPAGAGKTTLAAAWCETRDWSVHVQLDEVRSLIVGGYADPQAGGSVAERQYSASVAACCVLARAFLSEGYDAAIDDVFEPEVFEREWKQLLMDLPFRLVVLLPTLEETLRRSASRAKRVKAEITRIQHAACTAWPVEIRFDTTGQDVDSSLAVVRESGLLP